MKTTELFQKTFVLLNEQTAGLKEKIGRLDQLEVTSKVVNFAQLEEICPTLKKTARQHNLDFLLFAQNDQVLDKKDIGATIRALRAGYSSFSGIDDSMYLSQTSQCLDDLIAGQAKLNWPSGELLKSSWQPGDLGFSLIFDTEQMGGVRFGLPRILDLLEDYQTPATFFVTGFVAKIYPDLLPALRDRGHSVGVHGRYHEYLSNLDLPSQIISLNAEKKDFKQQIEEIRGANFIMRMNRDTVEALVDSGFDYFVASMENFYFPFAYRRMPIQPLQLCTDRGSIWMIPIALETYNRPLFRTRLAIDSAVSHARRERAPAVTVLMHPFRDGSLRHMTDVEKLLRYLRYYHELIPTTLGRVINNLPRIKPTVGIYVDLGDGMISGFGDFSKKSFLNWNWHNYSRYWQRIGHLYSSLKTIGHSPVLCLSCPKNIPVFAVYPHLPRPSSDVISIYADPTTYGQSDLKLLSTLNKGKSKEKKKTIIFRPGTLRNHINGMYQTSQPKRFSDLLGFFAEIMTRITLRSN